MKNAFKEINDCVSLHTSIFQNWIYVVDSRVELSTTLPRGAGSIMLVHVSHHCGLGSILAPCSYLNKVNLVTCEKSVVQFDSTKHRRFSPGTPVSSCSNTGAKNGGPY